MLKPQRNQHRSLVSLDGFWSFRKDPDQIGESLGWPAGFEPECEIAVPGSWNEQRVDLMHYFGRGWYATDFAAPESWAGTGISLHVGSAQNHARVWLNGHLVGAHRGGSLPFECDLSAHVTIGARNRLVLEVDGSISPWDLPPGRVAGNGSFEGFHDNNPATAYDFFPYAGLARPVSLQVTPRRCRLQKIRTDSTVNPAKASAEVIVEVTCTPGAAGQISVTLDGRSGTSAVQPDGRARITFQLDQVRLWDIGQPNLYPVHVALKEDGREIDSYEQTIGLRHIETNNDQLLLNGRPVFLKGFGKHEDFPVVGKGLVPAVVVRDFDLLHWIGANSFRTSHYPYAEEWYEYADRHGILVIGETPFVGLCRRMYRPDVLERALGITTDMIERDRHHPSVIMWSVANEPTVDVPEGTDFLVSLIEHARALDPRRPVTYVAHLDPEHNAAMSHCDVVCFNKYYGWYELPGNIPDGTVLLGGMLDRFRAAFGKPVILSEFGADAVAGLHTLPSEMFSEEFQADMITAQFEEARRRPWVIGTHVWAFADFKTGQSITRVVYNQKGIFTRDRNPKLAAHALRKLWAGPHVPATSNNS